MGKFDPIDIFFIAIITAYLITLICILISLLIIYHKNKKTDKLKIVVKDLNKQKAKEIEPKKKISDNKIFRALFMTEVKEPKKEIVGQEEKAPPKVSVKPKESFKPPAHNKPKNNNQNKKTNVSQKTTSNKKTSSNSNNKKPTSKNTTKKKVTKKGK